MEKNIVLFKKKEEKTIEKELNTKENLKLDPNNFMLKTGIWDSDAERKTYFILKSIINENYIIMPHVAFQDLFLIKEDTLNISEIRNQIQKYHFDFVIFDSNFLPVLLIEVNGRYHTQASKKETDAFKRQLVSLSGNNLQLIEIDLFDSNNDEELKETIEKSLYGHITSRNKYPAYCPICHSVLTYLYRKDGTAAFYKCPKCRRKNQPEKNKTFNEEEIFPLLKGMR